MAKREIKGNAFIRCNGFWQPDEGESFTGILIDCNEKAKDQLSGEIRPLYLFGAVCPKGEKSTFVLDKQDVKLKAGDIVGVNSTGELAQKLGANVKDAFGHELTITYTKKDTFVRDGKTLPIKRFTVMVDDELAKGSITFSKENGGATATYASFARPNAPPIGQKVEQAHPTANAAPVPFDIPTGAS